MKEKNIQTLFGKQNEIHGVFELKLCKGKSIRWDSVKDHQIEALMRISGNSGLYHKFSDVPFGGMIDANDNRMRFTRRSPFDCFFLKNIPAYVVICWYEKRKKKVLHYIDVNIFLDRKLKSAKKSFRESESEEMAAYVVDYMS